MPPHVDARRDLPSHTHTQHTHTHHLQRGALAGVDVLISAPQKGWSGPASAGFVMLSDAGVAGMLAGPAPKSYALNLKTVGKRPQ